MVDTHHLDKEFHNRDTHTHHHKEDILRLDMDKLHHMGLEDSLGKMIQL
tara:strand:- start:158 stop:304 length:147 start_codon:yes stop_codon:yes gene_type:complete